MQKKAKSNIEKIAAQTQMTQGYKIKVRFCLLPKISYYTKLLTTYIYSIQNPKSITAYIHRKTAVMLVNRI